MGSSKVKWCEPTVGLGVQLGPVLQEKTRHSVAAPAAGAVKGRPAVDGARVDLGPRGE